MRSPLSVITLASRNEGKRQELLHWLENANAPFSLALNESVGDIEETGLTFLENAWLKAESTPPITPQGWVLAEDSGLVVEALDGQYEISPFPGIYSNRWLTTAIRQRLLGQSFPNRAPLDRICEDRITNSDLCYGILALMTGQANRLARYCCGMVLWQPATGRRFEVLESSELQVLEGEPRGLNGFGYDPIMIPVGELAQPAPRTMAELEMAEKNRISHRGKAFQAALDYLQSETL